jgi:hypothetical protein
VAAAKGSVTGWQWFCCQMLVNIVHFNALTMIIETSQYPVVIQAYQPSGNSDLFVAEQVVHNQAEADIFTSRYAGLLIKARKPNDNELYTNPNYVAPRTRSRGPGVGLIILLLLIALVIVGFTTGWIQNNLGISLN